MDIYLPLQEFLKLLQISEELIENIAHHQASK
jgi:hypothetical protein